MEKFEGVITKAKQSCNVSNINIYNHFVGADKMVKTGDSVRNIIDYKLSRYACYLIVQNGDPRKEVIALGQTYFAIQTRKMELSEKEYNEFSEDEKRLYQRSRVKKRNYTLNVTAKKQVLKILINFIMPVIKGYMAEKRLMI